MTIELKEKILKAIINHNGKCANILNSEIRFRCCKGNKKGCPLYKFCDKDLFISTDEIYKEAQRRLNNLINKIIERELKR